MEHPKHPQHPHAHHEQKKHVRHPHAREAADHLASPDTPDAAVQMTMGEVRGRVQGVLLGGRR